MTLEQNKAFNPSLVELRWHKPAHELLEAYATYGCEAGSVLLGVRGNELVSGCSFMETSALSVFGSSIAHPCRNLTNDSLAHHLFA